MALRSVVCLLILACSAPAARPPAGPGSMQTVDSVPPRPASLQPPATLTDEGPAPRAKESPDSASGLPSPTPADEALRAAMPFAPAIAMDPVDGSKISIRAATPRADYKGRIYYFSSEANKRTFLAKPDQYTKGLFSHL